jgi:hypothetical protein
MKIETGRWFNTKTWERKGLIIRVEDQDDFSSMIIVYIGFDYRSAISDEPTAVSDEFTILFKTDELINYKPNQKEVHSALKFIFTDWELLE